MAVYSEQHTNMQSIQSLADNFSDIDDLNKRIAENVMNKMMMEHQKFSDNILVKSL